MKKNSLKSLQRTTRRLTIRPLTAHDYSEWASLYSSLLPPRNEWDETQWERKYLTVTEFRKILHRQKQLRTKDQNFTFAVFRQDDGALVGLIELDNISRGRFQNAYIGYRIFNLYWGYGYAKEAVKAALEIGFRELQLHRIEAGIQAKNESSIAVAAAAKMRFEGVSRKRIFYDDRWVDLQIYAATSEAYKIKHPFSR